MFQAYKKIKGKRGKRERGSREKRSMFLYLSESGAGSKVLD